MYYVNVFFYLLLNGEYICVIIDFKYKEKIMEKTYITPDAEFIRITGDALSTSTSQKDNGLTDIDDLKDFDPSEWENLF